MEPFVIDFKYNGSNYSALVCPAKDGVHYSVKIEEDNQEMNLNIRAIHCGENKLDWCFKDEESTAFSGKYDKEFLQEIGEAIEKYQTYI